MFYSICGKSRFRLSVTIATVLGGVWLAGAMIGGPSTASAAEDGKKVEIEASRDWLGGIPEAPTEDWGVAFGGRLYDNWAAALDEEEPKETHRAYPAGGKKKGYSTWRCKECHGWDYRGAKGVYGEGSHFTGIKGIDRMVGRDPNLVNRILRDDTHGYTREMIPESAMKRLALFVTRGQHDVDRFIDGETKKARGDAARGERFFQNMCSPCHGFDGKAINFRGADAPEYVGTVAQANPWETLHKIRNGQPGAPMPALRILPTQTLVDILAYTQTLPAK